MRNHLLEEALSLIEAAGFHPTVEYGGKHIKVRWRQEGASKLLVCAKSSSDRRSIYNMRSDLRRMLKP